jgi:hypothetical protein
VTGFSHPTGRPGPVVSLTMLAELVTVMRRWTWTLVSVAGISGCMASNSQPADISAAPSHTSMAAISQVPETAGCKATKSLDGISSDAAIMLLYATKWVWRRRFRMASPCTRVAP